MKIYKVPLADAGERWLPTQAQAQACARAYKGEFEIVSAGEDGREGMCAMLNTAETEIGERLGDEAAPDHPLETPPPLVVGETYTEKGNRFEDEFAAMPIATQLHYAALAMENARAAL